jgi:Zn-dependent membrane protease YugP
MKYIITVAFAILLFCIGCIVNVKPLIYIGALFGFASLFILALETSHEKR